MNYLELFSTALTALRGNVMRTALTMLGIVIGITSVILIVSLAQGVTASITNQVSSFGSNLIIISPGGKTGNAAIRTPGNIKTLTYEDAQAISKLQHIIAVSALVSSPEQILANGQNTQITVEGVQEGFQTISSINMQEGTFISQDDEAGLTRVAVLGPQVVTDLFGQDANPIGQNIEVGSQFFRIIGVTQSKGSSGFENPDDTVYVPVTTALTELLGQTYVQTIMSDADSPQEVEPSVDNITQLLLDRHKITDPNQADFTINTSKQALTTLNTITGLLTAMLAGIAAISLLVGGIGIMNIMLVTVTERTREVGLLKAIGAKEKDILTQFLIESIVLTLTGGAVGIALGVLLSYVITTYALHVPFVIQLSSVILAVGVSTIVGVVFGIYPARRAAKLNPIDALRFE